MSSAITNGDEGRWFTMLTDRTFAASATGGRIEILINRQLSTVDSSRLTEPLDEPGPNGDGYVLQARLSLHISESLQDTFALIRKRQTLNKHPLRMTVGPGFAGVEAPGNLNAFEESRQEFVSMLQTQQVEDVVISPAHKDGKLVIYVRARMVEDGL